MKFFKPSDFEGFGFPPRVKNLQDIADFCNSKLEREGKVVYGTKYNSEKKWAFDQQGVLPGETTHTALLICIEPINVCEHPSEKVYHQQYGEIIYSNPPIEKPSGWYCTSCNQRVKATKWEVSE